MKDDLSQLNDDYNNLYADFEQNMKKIFPGSQDLQDNFAKAIALVDSGNIFLKPPSEHREHIEKIKNLLEMKDENTKILHLYADDLHYVKLFIL